VLRTRTRAGGWLLRCGRWRREMFAFSEGLIVAVLGLVGVLTTASASVVAAWVVSRVRRDTRELRNNGGSSLRDAVDRIEVSSRQAEIASRVAVVVAEGLQVQVAGLQADVTSMGRTLDAHSDALEGVNRG
jgi:hypothetical protein